MTPDQLAWLTIGAAFVGGLLSGLATNLILFYLNDRKEKKDRRRKAREGVAAAMTNPTNPIGKMLLRWDFAGKEGIVDQTTIIVDNMSDAEIDTLMGMLETGNFAVAASTLERQST